MEYEGETASLSVFERRIVKRLCNLGETNQDIQALINKDRKSTINFGRISSVKKDDTQEEASEAEVSRFLEFKAAYDARTGLNPFVDERLIKSREAMKLAVHVFNSPTLSFRAETFSLLAVTAWTYLVIEYSFREGMPTERKNGSAISLSDFLSSKGCPFSSGVRENLKALVKVRDLTAHRILGPFEDSWICLFQASCLNFEREIVRLFDSRLSLSAEMSFAIQFTGLSIGQAIGMAASELPEKVASINKEVFSGLPESLLNDQEFQFSVVYTTVDSSKSKAAIQFVSPETSAGKEISNVLVKMRPSHITHPYRPSDVVNKVIEKTGRNFNMSMHSDAWRKHGVRVRTH